VVVVIFGTDPYTSVIGALVKGPQPPTIASHCKERRDYMLFEVF
jgi:hypothetical protein